MLHSRDLSSRPGLSSAESIKSGRLHRLVNQAVVSHIRDVPCSCKNIDPVQTFGTIHLSQHLIDYSVCNASAIMSSLWSD